ncbi:hypothetical protein C8R45DRAFT_11405 [Mycena sanguinolenta]|nr:hypothetical protein C8R45DRAFT_11405 [Mycena sanguinolenta]
MSSPLTLQQTANEPITHSKDRWFSDGNVVLQAGNTVLFRVHWGVLAHNSSVFRDMQGLPQPSDEPSVDGCPVVQLHDDPTDVEYLLKALYEPTFLTQNTHPLAFIGALVRLGRKYDFKEFRDFAVGRLKAQYPTTLQEYDARLARLPKWWDGITYYSGISVDILALASENGISSALPFAYYYLIAQDDLVERIDKPAALPTIHLRRCVLGQQRLLMKRFQPGYTFGCVLDAETFHGCTAPTECRKTREGFMRRCLDSSRMWAFFSASSVNIQWKLCASCNLHATEAVKAGRIKLWADLPQLFDLPPWHELLKDE